jgi:nicotinamidase/pyrazinamidase
MNGKKALILVDIQNDFCLGGSLEVKDADQIVPVINQMLRHYDLVVATQDFHPKNHKSFASNNKGANVGEIRTLGGQPQVMWPDHCVQETKGCEMHSGLMKEAIQKTFQKGTNIAVDSYSGFFDNDHSSSTGLAEFLKEQGVTEVTVVGLALDYCVKYTALDSKNLGFETSVLLPATRAVNLTAGDDKLAIKELKSGGVIILES